MRLAIPCLLLIACAPTPEPSWRHAGTVMGTTYAALAPRLPEGLDGRELSAQVDAILFEIDARLSTWKPDSELSRFNVARTTDWFEVSPDTADVVTHALGAAQRSGGAFDPTVMPLVELWGFGPAGGRPVNRLPTEEEVDLARARVGYALVEARADPPALRKARADVALDLSGIGEGHALDAVVRRLESLGLESYLVELGGELRVRGRGASGSPWRVALEGPEPGPLRTRARRVIELEAGAIATSGDARKAFEHDGRRYPHVLDPRTGRPVTSDVASVTVVAASAAQADALATALLVLGPDAGFELAARERATALFLVRSQGALVERVMPGFPARGDHP